MTLTEFITNINQSLMAAGQSELILITQTTEFEFDFEWGKDMAIYSLTEKMGYEVIEGPEVIHISGADNLANIWNYYYEAFNLDDDFLLDELLELPVDLDREEAENWYDIYLEYCNSVEIVPEVEEEPLTNEVKGSFNPELHQTFEKSLAPPIYEAYKDADREFQLRTYIKWLEGYIEGMKGV